MSKTNFFEDKVLGLLRGAAYVAPATVYVGLIVSYTDGEVPTWTEASGSWYARQPIALTAANPTANISDILFPAITGAGVTVVRVAVFDALAAGNALIYNDAVLAKTLGVGDQYKITVGAFTHSED